MTEALHPALSVPLNGRAMIEASAGTGKTWTLSAMVLRLLLEAERPPRQIVATTFTRKAAAEMQRRIQQDLQHIYQHYQQLNPDKVGEIEALPDPLLRHLFQYHQARDWQRLGARLRIVQNELNQMFIGTLDALCQRWLGEYALETGSPQKRQLLQDEHVTEALTHDALRQQYQRLWAQYPQLLQNHIADFKEEFSSLTSLSQEAMAFTRAHLDALPELTAEALMQQRQEALLQAFDGLDWDSWAQQTEALLPRFYAGRGVAKYWPYWADLKQKIRTQQKLDHNSASLLKAFTQIQFKKNQEDTIWLNRPERAWLEDWYAFEQSRRQQALLWTQSLLHASIEHQREALPAALAQRGETTFSEDWRRLNQALETGTLAQSIRHRYPVILVDESQDLNGEQSSMLEAIYLNEAARLDAFILLVGDPKQAIYRFRGGEVVHHQRLKQAFSEAEQHALRINRRASPALLAAINHHYQGATRLGEGIHYQNVSGLEGERALTWYHGGALKQPFIWLESESNQILECQQIVRLTQMLLRGDSLFSRQGKRLQPRDIMILARSNQVLQDLAQALQQVGIESALQNSAGSIFQSEMAQQMTLFLHAALEPYDAPRLHALLGGLWFQQPWLQPQTRLNETVQQALLQAQQDWQRYGLLSAVQHFLSHCGVWKRLAQTENGLPYLIHLRALLPIIAAHSSRLQASAFYDWWLMQMSEPPEADWAQMPPLPSQNAVQLMTVHKAKGLQAPVVIVMGLGQKRQQRSGLQLKRYTQHQQTHLAVGELSAAQEALWQQEEQDEQARWLYVALTRAEDLLFVLRRPKNGLKAVEALWDGGLAKEALYWLDVPQHQDDVILPQAEEAPLTQETMRLAAVKQHWGWHRSSFTALTQGQTHLENNDLENESLAEITPPEALLELTDDYRFRFPRGAAAGTFLHHLLERLAPQSRASWSREIERQAQRHQLELEMPAFLTWLDAIYHTPLQGSGLRLWDMQKRSPELSFMMALGGKTLPFEALQALFARYGKALHLQADQRHYRYLRGEIDLVYQHQGRYFIVDYKSNHLGHRLQDYHASALTRSMNEHQYWLQAAIYQLALYRRLRLRADFVPEQLGGVEYLFLRGVHPQQCSSVFWQPPFAFIEAFDALLGGRE